MGVEYWYDYVDEDSPYRFGWDYGVRLNPDLAPRWNRAREVLLRGVRENIRRRRWDSYRLSMSMSRARGAGYWRRQAQEDINSRRLRATPEFWDSYDPYS